MASWSPCCTGWFRPTSTWGFCSKPNSPEGSTHGSWCGIGFWQRTFQAATVEVRQFYTGICRTFRWSPTESMAQTSSTFRWRRGSQLWFVMGYYLAPYDASSIECVIAATVQCPWGTSLLVPGDFNAGFAEPEGHVCNDSIFAAVMMAGLKYISGHFLLCQIPWEWEVSTWSMLYQGREVKSCTYYIIGLYRRLFQNVSVWYSRHNTDHYIILGFLHDGDLRGH